MQDNPIAQDFVDNPTDFPAEVRADPRFRNPRLPKSDLQLRTDNRETPAFSAAPDHAPRTRPSRSAGA